ncbi:MAG: spore maturation protein CgeB [Myxococcota bacterium]|jgi:spore maturation protein CgeB
MGSDPRRIKTLLIYQDYAPGAAAFYQSHIATLVAAGFDVKGFCITPNPPAKRFAFPELDRMWRRGDPVLGKLYEALAEQARDRDVSILFNGANLHPEFLRELSTFNAYMCFDDPESSELISKPVAKYFDASFVANIASLEQYRAWGCSNVFYRPFGFHTSHVDPDIDVEQIRSDEKDIDASIFCERISPWRKERLDLLEEEIPTLYGRGHGWPLGYVGDDEMMSVYRRSKIGINLHNSTGPINFRTFALPANGVMQICDNKYFLGQIFELGKEVVGYSEIEEVPDLARFYLANDDARMRIAQAGYERAHRDYGEAQIFYTQMTQIAGLL